MHAYIIAQIMRKMLTYVSLLIMSSIMSQVVDRMGLRAFFVESVASLEQIGMLLSQSTVCCVSIWSCNLTRDVTVYRLRQPYQPRVSHISQNMHDPHYRSSITAI